MPRFPGRLALVGIGVEPGLSDVFARYAADELFAELSEKAAARPPGSATVAALEAGVHAQGKKLLEEAGLGDGFDTNLTC